LNLSADWGLSAVSHAAHPFIRRHPLGRPAPVAPAGVRRIRRSIRRARQTR
jgi:hypothetical protein